MREDRYNTRREIMAMLALIGQIGIVMITSILIPTLLFAYIGKRVGISWLAVIGFFLGAVAGGQGVYRLVSRYIKRKDDTRTTQIK